MPITLPSFKPTGLTVDISYSENVKIENLAINNVNTEVSHVLSTNLKTLIIRDRSGAKVQMSFITGESGTKYLTLPKGTTLTLSDLDFSGKTLYVQADKVTTLEIVELY